MSWLALVESNTTGSGRLFCRAARASGMRPVVLTTDPDRYPYLLTDALDSLVVDNMTVDTVVDVCERLVDDGLAGVTSSSEYFVATAAAVAEKLGLPGPDPDALDRCRDKGCQRLALAGAGLPVPEHRVARSAAAATAAAHQLGWPVIVKPVSGSGSVGVRLCRDSAEVRRWAGDLLGAGVNERGLPVDAAVLVERYVDGPEFSVETFDRTVIEVVGKHLGNPPYFVETGHDVPAAVSAERREELARVTEAALDALGLSWGAAHTELRYSDEGPVIIEVNPRLAGGMIPQVIQEARGIDLIGSVIARAAGLAPPEPGPGAGAGAIRFVLAPGTGSVTSVPDTAILQDAPGVRAAEISVVPGDRVSITHSFLDRVGYALAVGDDIAAAARRAAAAARRLRIEVGDE